MQFSKFKINNLLVILSTIALMVCILTLSYRQFVSNRAKVTEQFHDYQSLIAHQFDGNLKTFFQTRGQGLKLLSTYPSMMSDDLEEIKQDITVFFEVVKKFHIKGVSLFQVDGRPLFATGDPYPIPFMASELDSYRKNVSQETVYILSCPAEPTRHVNGIFYTDLIMASPIWKSEEGGATPELFGYLAYTFDTMGLVEDMLDGTLAKGGDPRVSIFTKDGRIIYLSAHPEMVGLDQELPSCTSCHEDSGAWLNPNSLSVGTVDFEMEQTSVRLLAYKSFSHAQTGWVLTISEDREQILGFISKSFYETLMFLALIAIIMFLASTVVYKNVRSVSSALQAAEHLKEKEHLWRKIKEQQVYLESILNHSHDLICTITQDGTFGFANPHWEELTGKSLEAIHGTQFWDIFPPEERKKIQVLLKNLDRRLTHVFELELTDTDGKAVPFLASTTLIGEYKEWLLILKEITDLKSTQADLESSRDEAQKANLAKSEFLANMSHEIRTPMNAVLGLSELVLETELDENQTEYLSILHKSAEQLLSIINDILDISKIEAGMMEVSSIPFDPRETLRGVCDTLGIQANKKSLDLYCKIEESVPSILVGDEVRLRQVLVNLTINAIKFTQSGSIALKVNVMRQEKNTAWLQIHVEDSGIGISADQLERVFESFHQVESSSSRQYSGTGLGLSISKRLVEKMGGCIRVASEVGKGSCFTLEIPFTMQVDDEEAEKRDPPNAFVSDSSDAPANDMAPQDLELLKQAYEDKKVLIAEDNPLNQMIIQAILAKVDLNIEMVSNGLDAIEAAKRTAFDLIFLDVQMPGIDGLTASREIRNLNGCDEVPIIAITARAMDDDKRKCSEAGMTDFLGKPFTQKELFAMLKKWR